MAVRVVQRFANVLPFDLDFPVLVRDGVYEDSVFGDPVLQETRAPARRDIATLTARQHRRVVGRLQAAGLREHGGEPDARETGQNREEGQTEPAS